MIKEARKLLKTIYGYDDFREGQTAIVESVLKGRDTLGIIATGGGKSVCYQIPSLIFKGLTIVVSPLISLMKDQVDALDILGIQSAFLNSSLSKEEYIEIIKKIKNNKIKILYVSPERLENESFINMMKEIKISLLAIDEAHCISQWGHDFRKTYLVIPEFSKKIGKKIQVLALTATATPEVKEDIITKMEMSNYDVHVDSFDRANIYMKVERGKEPEAFIVKYINENKNKSGIIYATTRKEVDSLYAYLKLKGFNVAKYHAGLTNEERVESQEKFVKDEIKIIIATNAFGMGIDKSNVRYVIHRNIPKDIESYYQEMGRVGRDGAPGEAVLLFYEEDEGTHKYFIENNSELTQEIKKIKLKKLDKMVDYAYIESCYREYILKYFGEKRIKNYCGNCYNCSRVKDIEELTEEAQMVFSCIGRAKESIGVSSLVNILLGKLDTKLEKKGYQTLSTFGIMKDKERVWLEEFVNFLISEKYLYQSAGSFPILNLTKKAYDVVKSLKNLKRKKGEKVTFDYYNDELFQEFLELREKISKEEGVAPYNIFSDLTLMELSDKKPQTRWEMLKIRGVGNQKFKNYGERFLNIINRDFKDENFYYSKERLEIIKEQLNINSSLLEIDRVLKDVLK
ncbi:MAG: DNA helicase RecQ [Fusobacteriaceae bacterium]|nr:DNA helicase RecQ [Fusobacteriaceae bacterium]